MICSLFNLDVLLESKKVPLYKAEIIKTFSRPLVYSIDRFYYQMELTEFAGDYILQRTDRHTSPLVTSPIIASTAKLSRLS